MTPEQLLMPRYWVKVHYPNSPFAVGQLIQMESKGRSMTAYEDNTEDVYRTGFIPVKGDHEKYGSVSYEEKYFSECPDIFQELMWFEEREDEDLPKYLRNVVHKSKYVIKVVKYEPYYNDSAPIPHWAYVAYMDDVRHDAIIFFDPATEEDYIKYLATLPDNAAL